MKAVSCDVAVIGAGTAGLAARRAAVAAGARTILVESGPGGTTCARFGCMPSKLLLAAARAAAEPKRAFVLGVGGGARPRVRGTALLARLRRERDHFVAAILEEVARIPAAEKIAGHARFDGETVLLVDDHTRIEARAVVIATGAAPDVPPALAEICGDRVLTHETVFDLPEIPRSIAIVGAGPLGLELGLALSRLGARAAIFDKGGKIGGLTDAEVNRIAVERLGGEVSLCLGVDLDMKRSRAGAVRIGWTLDDGTRRTASFDHVLSAAGRPPRLKGLDLKMAGIELGDDGVPAFDLATLQCGKSAVFIAGDANGARPVLHEASAQGERAGANAARWPKIERAPAGVPFAVVFSDPDIALVGEAADPDNRRAWAIGASADNGRDRVEARPAGLIRLHVRREDRRVAAGQMVGPNVEFLAQMLAWIVGRRMTVDEALALPFYHPTPQEGLRAALEDARTRLG